MHQSKVDEKQIKSVINNSYNRLYAQFTLNGLNEVGNYKILKQIGEGSFGKVYLALHKLTHRKVVLKTSDKTDPNVVREVFYHRQFDFPYIIKLYEVIVTETKVWMALEYCPGKELYEYLLVMQRIPPDESARLFAQIAGAVYYAHSLNCVHRDLKLENILLDKRGNAKLADFGFTRECATKAQLETICGTTVYMAPELLQREKYDGFKIDVWSLGVILYTMINGSMPFDEDEPSKTEWKIINEMPEFKDKIFNEDSKNLLEQILDKDPKKRPTMEQILRHPFLEPYGSGIIEQSEKILSKQRKGLLSFHTKAEQHLLKKLKQLGFDKQAIKSSVQKRKCDSLSGLWYLLLEQEKNQYKLNNPKKNRSMLSMKKVFESSSHLDLTLPPREDDMYSTLKIARSLSLKQNISVHYNSTNGANMSRKSTIENHIISITPIPSVIEVSTSKKEKNPLKANFFTKVSKFFKHKKEVGYVDDFSSVRQNSTYTMKSNLAANNKTMTFVKHNNDISLLSVKAGVPLQVPTDTIPPILKPNNESGKNNTGTSAQFTQDRITNKKRIKSLTYSELSENTPAGNYDSESLGHIKYVSYENLKVPSTVRVRPPSNFSQQSQISNDTYNSDCSTDGNTISLRVLDSSRQYFTPTYGNNSQILTTGEKNNNSGVKKFIRRDLSFMSTASSASEISSRADSFYDIATASGPIAKDGRGSTRSSKVEATLSGYDTQRMWKPSNGHLRRTNMRRRSLKRGTLQSSVGETQSVIKEESFSGSDSNGVKNDNLILTEIPSLPDEGNDPVINSEETTSAIIDVPNMQSSPSLQLKSTSYKKGRSFSEDSEWSQQFSDVRTDLGSVFIDDDEDIVEAEYNKTEDVDDGNDADEDPDMDTDFHSYEEDFEEGISHS